MNIIKNLSLLPNDVDKDKMEQGALLHRKYSNITFKVKEVTDKSVSIQVVQGKSPNEVYFPKKRLVEIVHETFDRFFPDKKILVNPIPYTLPPVEQVNAEWIKEKMLKTGIRIKDIVADTGLNESQISAWINDLKPISQQGKAMFYYYFLSKKQ